MAQVAPLAFARLAMDAKAGSAHSSSEVKSTESVPSNAASVALMFLTVRQSDLRHWET